MARRGRPTKEYDSRIAIARRALGLSRAELAKQVGVTLAYVYQLEAGTCRPGMKTALRLAEVLKMPVDFIVRDPVYDKQEADRRASASI